jgi:hypothetical protein
LLWHGIPRKILQRAPLITKAHVFELSRFMLSPSSKQGPVFQACIFQAVRALMFVICTTTARHRSRLAVGLGERRSFAELHDPPRTAAVQQWARRLQDDHP